MKENFTRIALYKKYIVLYLFALYSVYIYIIYIYNTTLAYFGRKVTLEKIAIVISVTSEFKGGFSWKPLNMFYHYNFYNVCFNHTPCLNRAIIAEERVVSECLENTVDWHFKEYCPLCEIETLLMQSIIRQVNRLLYYYYYSVFIKAYIV